MCVCVRPVGVCLRADSPLRLGPRQPFKFLSFNFPSFNFPPLDRFLVVRRRLRRSAASMAAERRDDPCRLRRDGRNRFRRGGGMGFDEGETCPRSPYRILCFCIESFVHLFPPGAALNPRCRQGRANNILALSLTLSPPPPPLPPSPPVLSGEPVLK